MADDEGPNDGVKASALERLVKIAEGAGKDLVAGAVGAAALSGGDPTATVGGALVGALRGGAKEGAAALARALWDSPADRAMALAGAVSVEAREHLELVAPIVEENVEKLLEDPDVRREDLASSTAAILLGWERAYRATGDAKKRRVIMAALGNAFRPELFKEGLTLRLFRILEDLDYPELRFLREEFGPERNLARWVATKAKVEAAENGRETNAATRALEASVRAGTRDGELLERLSSHRLVRWVSEPQQARVTWLGDRLLALCADSESLNRVWPDPGASPSGEA